MPPVKLPPLRNKKLEVYRLPSKDFKTEQELMDSYSLKIGKALGEGGFGTVFFSTQNEQAMAMKRIDIGPNNPFEEITEVSVLLELNHKFIIKFFGGFAIQNKATGNSTANLFLQLADTDLLKHVSKTLPTEDDASSYFGQILVGIDFMHQNGIAHRDIKNVNILLVSEQNALPNNNQVVKITDFGLSKEIFDKTRNFLTHTQCGTTEFMAPEVLEKHNKGYNPFCADVWSLGISLYQMLTLKVPYDHDKSEVLQTMHSLPMGHLNKMVEPASGALKDILRAMVEFEPVKRIKMDQLLTHDWVSAKVILARDLAKEYQISTN